MVASFACATLTDAMMQALEVENAHERYHIPKGSGQSDCQHHKLEGHGQQSLQQ